MKNRVSAFCENTKQPIGIDTKYPKFSWKIEECEGIRKQKGYCLYLSETKEELERSRKKCKCIEEKSEKNYVLYRGKKLESCKRYYWQVVVEYDQQTVLESEISFFETGFMDESCWKAKWISPQNSEVEVEIPKVSEDGIPEEMPIEQMKFGKVWRVRREFEIEHKKIKTAKLYATARGVYLPLIDGKKLGNYELAPGYSDYRNQIWYQIYDVKDMLSTGNHTLGFILADGWYTGHIGFYGENCQYGKRLSLLAQIMIEYEDGTKADVVSDENFEAEQSAYVYSDLMVGEKLDARRKKPSFFLPGYIGAEKMEVVPERLDLLHAQYQNTVKVIEEILPVSIKQEAEAEWLVDFGQCIAGKICIQLNQKKGTEIRIEHSEVLGKDGTFEKNICEPYKDQTDIYVCEGVKDEQYEPMFTYHGFRYIKIIGIEGNLKEGNLKAKVIGSKIDRTGQFTCSNTSLNQLQKNIVRSQVSNMISIPTDCPQREKSGWTGDVLVYENTACFNQNMETFFGDWLRNLRFNQRPDGQIPIIVPWIQGYGRAFEGIDSSAGWSDVIISLPWTLYQYYGDAEVLRGNYPAMKKWMDYLERVAVIEQNKGEKYILNKGFHFGDWLTPSVSMNFATGEIEMMQSAICTMDIVPTIYFAISCKKMQSIAEVLEYQQEEKYYEKLYESIKTAFRKKFIDQAQQLKSNLQGVHVLVLKAGLLCGKERENVQKRLVQLIHENGDKLDTGFLSTPFLLDVLTEMGEEKLACKILLNEECPSWLYEIKQGATSIWESWQAILPDGKFSHLSMNHYAFGCIGDYLYRHFGGIQRMLPGYKKILIAPAWNSCLEAAETTYESVYGTIRCAWKRKNGTLNLTVEIPANTEGEINLPELGVREKIDSGVHNYCFKYGILEKNKE